jgi:hypothetical protein
VRRDLRKVSIKNTISTTSSSRKKKKLTYSELETQMRLEPHLSSLVPVTIWLVVGSGGHVVTCVGGSKWWDVLTRRVGDDERWWR